MRIHAYIHMYTDIHVYTYISTYLPTYIHACMHAYIHRHVSLPQEDIVTLTKHPNSNQNKANSYAKARHRASGTSSRGRQQVMEGIRVLKRRLSKGPRRPHMLMWPKEGLLDGPIFVYGIYSGYVGVDLSFCSSNEGNVQSEQKYRHPHYSQFRTVPMWSLTSHIRLNAFTCRLHTYRFPKFGTRRDITYDDLIEPFLKPCSVIQGCAATVRWKLPKNQRP